MKKIALLSIISLFSTLISAQNRFAGGVFAGVNLAQIDGDYQQGYRKKMFGGGIRAAMILGKNFDIGTELMYNGKGAMPSSTDKSSRKPNFSMTMHYAEAALMANFHFDQNEEGFNEKTIQIGLSYGRLLSSKVEILNLSIRDTIASKPFLQENIKNVDVNFIVGFSYRFTPKIGISFRHSYSLTPFFLNNEPRKPRTLPDQRDYYLGRSYFLSAHLFYDLWTPELRKVKKGKKKIIKK